MNEGDGVRWRTKWLAFEAIVSLVGENGNFSEVCLPFE